MCETNRILFLQVYQGIIVSFSPNNKICKSANLKFGESFRYAYTVFGLFRDNRGLRFSVRGFGCALFYFGGKTGGRKGQGFALLVL